ncbi:MAG: hypothetical protein IT372_00215 [Polyangiaceae bacterium]|nr:hypothetical protein [Polyangiaceae bacterium]
MTPRSLASKSLLALALATLAAGCGDDGDSSSGGGGSTPGCGTTTEPTVLELRDVTPAAGSSVENDAIVQAFTVVAAPGVFQTMTFTPGDGHTAGTTDPASLQYTATPQGADIRYEITPVTWINAPSHVEIRIDNLYQDTKGCVFAFPEPLFSYDVTPAGGGGGGAGGGGAGGDPGTGGAGGGG